MFRRAFGTMTDMPGSRKSVELAEGRHDRG
jgi:hypothetical protein